MKAAVIFESTTGNTEAMAKAICEGAREKAGAENVTLSRTSDITADEAARYDVLILGSPAMGAEVLEEEFFEPFFSELEGRLGGKRVALFGSYDWGDGQWMRDWEDRCRSAGAALFNDKGLIIRLAPDAEGLAACKQFGAEAVG